MKRSFEYRIAASDDGQPIKRFLRARGYTAAVLTMLKAAPDGIVLNGERVFVTATVHTGDRLVLSLEDTDSTAQPEQWNVPVLYEDADVLIYDKPAGMAVHPTKKIQSGTLANDFACRVAETGEPARFRPVYRLDRGTTGMVVVAKHKLSCALLSGKVQKTYLCLCEGILPEHGTFDGSIGLSEGSTLRRCVRADGQPSLTRFERLDAGDTWSLARVTPETGRTHQIRCHFSDAGHPLLGDFLYGMQTPDWSRHALHCDSVTFFQPMSGERVTCHSPLPEDMAAFLKKNGKNFRF